MIQSVTQDDNLSNRATRGVIWMGLRQAILQVLLLVKVLLVASLLGPRIFGIFGIALLMVLFVEQITQIGVEFALIHRQDDHIAYDTAWTMRLLRGIILFVLIASFRFQIADVFQIRGFEPLILVVATTLLFEGLVNIGTVEFKKKLHYREEFLFKAIPDLCNIGFTIIFAFILFNIWALVIGLLVERGARLLLSYILHSYRPSFHLDVSHLSSLANYGKWIFIMGVLGFFLVQGAELFIGIILGATFVGLYQLSFKLATMPVTSISGVVSSVSIPTYAKIQSEPDQILKTFRITFFGQFMLYAIYVLMLLPNISEFVLYVLGTDWIDMTAVLRILLLGGFLSVVVTTVEPLFVANGMHRKLVPWQALAVVSLILIAVPVLIRYQLIGLAWLINLNLSITGVGYLIELKRIDIDVFSVVRDAFLVLMGFGGTLGFVIITRHLLASYTIWLVLLLMIASSIVFLLVIYATHRLLSFDFGNDLETLIEQNTSNPN